MEHSPPPPKRRGPDWEAAERDWRTGQFTLAELAAKYKTDPATISRKQKRDRQKNPGAWPKDLTKAVREATHARVLVKQIEQAVKEGQAEVKDTVLATAEANADVILRHRRDIKTLRALTFDLTHELTLATHSPARAQPQARPRPKVGKHRQRMTW